MSVWVRGRWVNSYAVKTFGRETRLAQPRRVGSNFTLVHVQGTTRANDCYIGSY
jgi:hypothetical protein